MLTRRLSGHGFAAAGEVLAVLLLSPLAVSFATHTPHWDELYFFHRAACVRNAVQLLSWPMADSCLDNMTKSPILALMLLPSAPLHGTESVAVAPIMLSLLSFGLLWLGVRMAQRGGISLPLVIVASAIAILAQPLWAGAPFLGDELAAIVVLDTLLLLPLETAVPGTTQWEAIRRGLLWGLLFSIGVLTKLTFFYFAGVVFASLTVLSWWQTGMRLTAWKLGAMAVVGLFPAAVFARYGSIYWSWAMSAAFGPIAALYNDHLQRWTFLRMEFGTIGASYWGGLAALLGIMALMWWWTGQRRALLVCCGLVAIVAGYLFIASGSPNKDPRFFWPIWLALPFCIAALGARVRPAGPTPLRGVGLAPAGVIILLSIATLGRFNLAAVTEAGMMLRSIPHTHPVTVFLAMDEATLNIETLTLAQQLDLADLATIAPRTVVYDFVAHRTVEDSIKRLLDADYVILRDPVDGTSPEWANRSLPQFAAAVEAKGRLIRTFPGKEETRIYAMH